MTSTGENEIGNVQKCLAAGCAEVILIASEPRTIRTLERTVAENLSDASRERVRVLSPEDFITHLDAIAAPTEEQRVRGYKVKVRHRPVGATEAKARSEAIARVLLQGHRRVKEKL